MTIESNVSRSSHRTTMRVAMVAPAFPLVTGPLKGGLQASSRYLCSALLTSHHIDLDIIRPFAPKGTPSILTVNGSPVHCLSRPVGHPLPLYLMWSLRRQIRRLLKKLEVDIVHVQGLASVAMLHHQQTVLTVHGIVERDVLFADHRMTASLRSLVLSLSQARARRRVRNVIAVSPYTRQFLASNGYQNIWDIPNPIEATFFALERKPICGRVFSASHCTKLKNCATLIRAFAIVARQLPCAELRLAGSGQSAAYGFECKRLATVLGVARRVSFLGELSLNELQEELRTASAFALCSLQENAPLAISEAMAAGVPVVASRVGGIPWMLQHGSTGFLIDPTRPEDIAARLSAILVENALERSSTAIRNSAYRYKPDIVAQQTIAAYRHILDAAM